MRLYFLLALLCLCSCSRQDDFAAAFAKCKAQNAPHSLDDFDDLAQAKNDSYECVKGANGPNISATSIDHQAVRSLSSEGQPVVLYYWSIPEANAPAYYSKSLYDEITALNFLADRYKSNIKFIGFSPNDATAVKSFMRQHPLSFLQVASADSIWAPLLDKPGDGPPVDHFIMFINGEGKVTKVSSGIYSNVEASVRNYTPILKACLINSVYND